MQGRRHHRSFQRSVIIGLLKCLSFVIGVFKCLSLL